MSKHTDFSRVFIDRPILATVLSALILVSGLMAIPNLSISEYPDVVPPSVQVTANYPGANPRTIADTVAGPIEEAVNGVENMIYMKSTSSADGQMALAVTFKGGTDIDLAAMQVQNRVAQAVPRLPEAVRALGVTTVKASSTLTMVVHLDSPNKTYDALYLSNFANLRVRDELARLPGVGQALAFGIGNYAMRVWIDPERAAARSLSATDIVAAIREQNVEVSAGAIGGPPTPAGSVLQVSINAQGRLASPEAFGEIVLKSDGAELTRLKDVARIELGANSYALRSLLNNEDAAAIVIFEAPGANTIALSDAIRARMKELEGTFPEDVHWSVVYDPTVFVKDSIASVIETLLEAIALVVIVVVLFLQTWRASLIPLVAVPVSIIGTFAVLWLLGFSINVLTLFGLVLAIGIVVDDAIVVVENVERHIESGKTPREAAHQAMSEVSGPIVAITLVLASVFVPLAFLGGVTGQFYKQFAVTIAAAVIISGFNSLTLSPALAAMLLQPHGARKDALGRGIERIFGKPFAAFNRALQGLRRALFRRHRRHHLARAAAHRDLRRADRRRGHRLPRGPGRLHPDPGQAVPVLDPAAARGREHRPHREGDAAHGRDRARRARREERGPVPGPQCDPFRRDAERRRHVRRPRAFRGTGTRGRRDRDADQHGLRADPGRARLRAAPAAGARARQCERARVLRRGPRRDRLRRAVQQHDGPHRGARADARLRPDGDLHVLPVERAAARRDRRPDQGQGARPRAHRRLQHAAGVSRLGLRQRLQPVRPHLFGVRAGGRAAIAPRCRTSRASRCATTAARWCRSAASSTSSRATARTR